MLLKIKIPKEFEEHFNMDSFKDSLERIYTDLRFETKPGKKRRSHFTLSGRYEMETVEMLRDAMSEAEVIKEED